MHHVAHRTLRSAAAAGLVSLAAACIMPPAGVAPRPEEADLPAPDVAFSASDGSPTGVGAGFLAYSTTRDAYTAAFEVDQRGRVRVITPASPRQKLRTAAGTSYVLAPMLQSLDREFLSPSTDFSRVPFVFVLTSDTPLNLSSFGTGSDWSHVMNVGARNPDSTIAEVARWVLPDAPAYGSDYAYVGPSLRVAEQAFVETCARPVEDVHDYSYYRALWAVFTPADQRLSINPDWLYSPALSWSSYALLPLAQYRAALAPEAFYGGCAGDAYGYGSYGSYAYNGGYYPGTGPYGGYPGYGFGYGYGYPIGYGVVLGNGPIRAKPDLRVPRTPNSIGSLQVVGTTGSAGSARAGTAAAAAQLPGRLAWRPLDAGRTPGEAAAFTPRVTLGERLPSFVHPTERRGAGEQPWAHAIVRAPAGGSAWNGRQPYGGAHPAVSPPVASHMPASVARPSAFSGTSGASGGSSGSSGPSRSTGVAAPSAGSASQSGGARTGRPQ